MDLSTRTGRREQGQRIQRAVERAGLPVEELAGRIGCSRALIYQYLAGTTLAQPDRLQQIAAECGVPLTYFYSDDQNDPEVAAPPALHEAPPQDVAGRLSESLRGLEELATAQESPPDFKSVAMTCERILSLASQFSDKTAMARAQRRLGSARLASADYPRAMQAFSRGVGLAIESGDMAAEMQARQGLGAALLAMGKVDAARAEFVRVADSTDFRSRWRGTLSLGGIHEMHGEYLEAMERFDEAAAILEEADISGAAGPREVPIGLLYVNANRANVYLDGGDFEGARPLAERCLADAEALGIAEQHLEARFNLTWCDLCTGKWPTAYRGLTTTLQLARFVGDEGRATFVRAWLGIFLAAAGDFDSAIAHGKDALAMALSRGDRRGELYAQLALADAYTGAGDRESEARYHTNQALAVSTALKQDRAEIECRLRQARLEARYGEEADRLDAATRAHQTARRLGARHLESMARYWIGEARFAAADSGAPPGEQGYSAARSDAEAALAAASDIEYVEAVWRSQDLLGRIALAEASPESAEQRFREAIDVLERLRGGLIDAGIPDTLLENDECGAVYLHLARYLIAQGRADEAAIMLDQTGWPPLTARVTAEA